ncbi:MAG TPA: histidine phosphatase family protein [Candidatus Babeliales bacterium]|nr:histidine phosphatase family protein [Candidatus Babeliales bacterium]
MKEKIFYLFRHGQTDWNLNGIMQGHADIPLNETGKKQAHELGNQLKNEQLEVIFTSDLQRANETAQIVSLYSLVPVHSTHALREINVGEYQGSPKTEFLKSSLSQYWYDFDPKYDSIGFIKGETKGQARTRIITFIESLLSLNYHRIGICSHSVVIQLLLHTLQPESSKALKNGDYIKLIK